MNKLLLEVEGTMTLCTTLTFDGDPTRLAAHVRDLEAAGVDMVLIPETYGFDQVSVLGFVAATTTRIGLRGWGSLTSSSTPSEPPARRPGRREGLDQLIMRIGVS